MAMDETFNQKLQALVAASGGKVKIVSGFRSTERQQQLWDAAVKKYGSAKEARKWVAPPGKSNHEKGVAADLGGDLAWAKANAGRFGLHMPMGHEPWHVEPADLKSAKTAYTTPRDVMGVQVPVATGAGAPATSDPKPDPDDPTPRKTVEFQIKSLVSLLASGGDDDGNA